MKKDVTHFGPTIDDIRQMRNEQAAAQPPITPPGSPQIIDPTTTPGAIPQGVGAGYVSNQRQAGATLSEDTVKGIEAQRRAQQEAEEKAKAEAEKAKAEAEAAQVQEQTEMLAEWGSPEDDALRSLIENNPFLEPGIREGIEANLQPIRLTDLLMGRGQQTVPILPDLEVEFQTMKGSEDLLTKQILREDFDALQSYFSNKTTALSLAVSLVRIGEKYLPPLEDPASNNRTTEKTILARFEKLMELPLPLVALLAIHMTWFDVRVKRVLTPSNLKNG